MRCEQVGEMMSARLDDRLTSAAGDALEDHLAACSSCRGERDALWSVDQFLAAAPMVAAPADLRIRVLARVERRQRARQALVGGATLAMGTAVLALLTLAPVLLGLTNASSILPMWEGGGREAVGLVISLLGTAARTGVGLGIEAAVKRIRVLRRALGAHFEAGHRRLLPVIGERSDNRESGTTVGAVDERVVAASIVGIEEFRTTVIARGQIWRHSRCQVSGSQAGTDHEALVIARRYLPDLNAVDACLWRRLFADAFHKRLQFLRVAFDFYDDSGCGVLHETGKAQRDRMPVYGRPESHALNAAGYGDFETCSHRVSRFKPASPDHGQKN